MNAACGIAKRDVISQIARTVLQTVKGIQMYKNITPQPPFWLLKIINESLFMSPRYVGIYTLLKLVIINSTMHLFPACIHGPSKCSPDIQQPFELTPHETCDCKKKRKKKTAILTSCPIISNQKKNKQKKKVSLKYIWTQAFDSSQSTYQLLAVTV